MSQATVRLADLCDVVTDRVEPEKQPDAVYVGLKHLETGRFARKGEGKAAETKSSKSAFRAGDILYGKLGAYLDKAVLVEDEGICSTDILVVRSRQDVDPRFLLGVIHSPQFIEHAVAGTTGVSHPRTSWSHISEFQFLSYSPEEQKNIGDFLWLMHKALTASEAVVELAKSLKQTALNKLFSSGTQKQSQKETEIGYIPSCWDVESVEKAVVPMQFDSKKQIPKTSYLENGTWSVVDQGKDLIAGYTDSSESIVVSDEPVIIFGDHTRIFKFIDFDFALGGQGTKPLLATDCYDPKFLYFALQNLDVPNRGYNRHYTVLRDLKIPRPPKEEQRRIVNIVDAIDMKTEMHQRKSDTLGEIIKAILQRVVIGELDSSIISSKQNYGVSEIAQMNTME